MTARGRLAAVLAPDVLDAIEELVAETVAAELQQRNDGVGSPWLSVSAAADYLGVSERTLEREVERGRLRSSPIGRRRLFHRDDLDRFARAAGEE